jgi:hypothetical protein
MEPDDLLCSRNARSRTPLVGRAHLRIDQAVPGEIGEESVKEGQEKVSGVISA